MRERNSRFPVFNQKHGLIYNDLNAAFHHFVLICTNFQLHCGFCRRNWLKNVCACWRSNLQTPLCPERQQIIKRGSGKSPDDALNLNDRTKIETWAGAAPIPSPLLIRLKGEQKTPARTIHHHRGIEVQRVTPMKLEGHSVSFILNPLFLSNQQGSREPRAKQGALQTDPKAHVSHLATGISEGSHPWVRSL